MMKIQVAIGWTAYCVAVIGTLIFGSSLDLLFLLVVAGIMILDGRKEP